MYQRLRSIGATLPRNLGDVLAISHSQQLANIAGLGSCPLVSADYPDHDILALDFADASFGYVVSDQVLEHVEGSPQQAVDECARILRPGGIAIHTTCFINPIHGKQDFWRFTPDALALLHRNWSEILEVGGWGNHTVWTAVRDGIRFDGVPHAKWHPLHTIATLNDPLWPISTWVVARK